MKRKFVFFAMLVSVAVLIACGGSGNSGEGGNPPPQPSIAVSVSPTTAMVLAGGTQQFSPTVTGTSNTAVTWTVDPGSAGSISSSGLFAAAMVPSTTTATVTAKSQADPTKSASASVTIQPAVSISVSPTNATLSASGTQQFTATVTNTTNTGVKWTINPAMGSITQTGLYTAPSSISSQSTVTITATSQADSTKSAAATLTLTPAVSSVITITGVTPPSFSADGPGVFVNALTVNGSGFSTGDICTVSGLGGSCGFVSSIKVNLSFGIGPADFRSGPATVTICRPDGTGCAGGTFVFFGSQNAVAASAVDFFAIGPQNGYADKFKTLNGSVDGKFLIGGGTLGLAFDNGTGQLLSADGTTGIFTFDPVTGLQTSNGFVAPSDSLMVAAKNNVGCAPQAFAGTLTCASVLSLSKYPPVVTVPAGANPWPPAMTDGCPVTMIYSYDREGTSLYAYAVSSDAAGNVTMDPAGVVFLPGSTPASAFHTTYPLQGDWYVAAFDSTCMAAIFAPVLNSDGTYTSKLWFVTGNPITLSGTPVVLPLYSFRIAADNAHQAVIVAYDDPAASLTRFVSVSTATGAMSAPLKSTSILRGGVLMVSSDGKSLYYEALDSAVVLVNQ